jgi:hypothetical protein
MATNIDQQTTMFQRIKKSRKINDNATLFQRVFNVFPTQLRDSQISVLQWFRFAAASNSTSSIRI